MRLGSEEIKVDYSACNEKSRKSVLLSELERWVKLPINGWLAIVERRLMMRAETNYDNNDNSYSDCEIN